MNNIINQYYSNRIKKLISSFSEVFTDKLGTWNTNKCKLIIKENFKPRLLPYKIKDQVGLELNRLTKEYILKPEETQIVPVPKANGTIHICGDYKIT